MDWSEIIKLPHQERIGVLGHRAYIGAPNPEMWYGIGMLQYQYLMSQGLRPADRFLDIACGSLRLGQFLIPFLERGNYAGLEAEPELVAAGLNEELRFDLVEQKQPKFSFGYDFDFSFVETFDVAIAQSLFTHLILEDIAKCFRNLRPRANLGSRFFFTFFEGDSTNNPDGSESDSHLCWFYSQVELQTMLHECGWRFNYIGEWNHPRNQMIAVATPL